MVSGAVVFLLGACRTTGGDLAGIPSDLFEAGDVEAFGCGRKFTGTGYLLRNRRSIALSALIRFAPPKFTGTNSQGQVIY
jgi:hypothetical protein